MLRLLFLKCCLFINLLGLSNTIIVKNIDELKDADKIAKPGDIIILQNGIWHNVTIKLTSKGSKDKPILYKATTAGRVIITGNSQLKIGGEYIIVEGLFFTNGFAGNDPVISFRASKDQLANNCRVTNCAIDDFNNPKRMDENNWVLFYGKNNQLDHCSFKNKKNVGVLLAVILDDDRSRENFHSIDHNYFGKRIPLASNGGEIIRVGVSQHCQFNSNTRIKNNFFEKCDGETEIISIKSCANIVESNIFKECQGSVVLRHGDNNIVTNNYFLGNDKIATGGVRVINKGQKVTNNIFYKCRGVDFRSPLAIMNGIPNSPAHRYVQVINAEIANNTFYECSPISLCEGSDAERTLPPDNVNFTNNVFYNNRDSNIYKVYDDIKGIHFTNNLVSEKINQPLPDGFVKTNLPKQDNYTKKAIPNKTKPPVSNIPIAEKEIYTSSGASWFVKHDIDYTKKTILSAKCATADNIYKLLATKEPLAISLTSTTYTFDKPLIISNFVRFTGNKDAIVKFTSKQMLGLFVISGNGHLTLENLNINGEGVKAGHFISSDSGGFSNHYNLSIFNSSIRNFDRTQGCQNIFYACKSMMADSIVIRGNVFENNNCNLFNISEEKDDKGYYNVEKMFINHNKIKNNSGSLLNIYRGGNDESTLGPNLTFSHNTVNNCISLNKEPLIYFTGIQVTNIFSNTFTNCNTGHTLIKYADTVRAKHVFEKNTVTTSGQLEKNQFVTAKNNTIK